MKKIVCLIMALLTVTCIFCSCGKKISSGSENGQSETEGLSGKNKRSEITTRNPYEVKTELGTGKNKFVYEIIKPDGTVLSYLVNTDYTNVGETLSNYGLITFSADEKGNETWLINGIDITEGEWVFYIDGKHSKKSPNEIEIDEMSIYSFVYDN